MTHPLRPVRAEIDLSAIGRNVRTLKGLTRPGAQFCAVVKADAYGHGAVETAKAALAAGADSLAVAIVDEAARLREAGLAAPILILGYAPPEQAALAAKYGITQTVFAKNQADALSAAGGNAKSRIKVHIKVDTGMSRIGVTPEEAPDFAAYVASLPGVELEGIFTHFATADSRDKEFAKQQFAAFTRTLDRVAERGIRIPIRHAANSAAILDLPETHLDMVRAGIALYGLRPSDETIHRVALRPAMRLTAKIAMVKQVPAGTPVSYGCTHVTTRTTMIATIPAGYADGYSRALGNRAHILVNGKRAPVAGRICMDQFMADVTGIEGVREGTEATLFGAPELPVEELADIQNTINYEVVCAVSKRVPRVYN